MTNAFGLWPTRCSAVVGPLSEAHVEATGGLRSWLQQSTEGHGAWLGSTNLPIDRGATAVFSGSAPNFDSVVTALFVADGALYAIAQPIRTAVPTSSAGTDVPNVIAVPFLDAATNATLSLCATGVDASCDAAQVPGVLDDGAFS